MPLILYPRCLFRWWRADDGFVQDIADRHSPCAHIDPKVTAFTLVTRGDRRIFARRLGARALPWGITERDAD